MSAQDTLSGGPRDSSGSGNKGKGARRRILALAGAGLAVALLLAVLVMQAWTPLGLQLGFGSPTATSAVAKAPLPLPTATDPPTPPPISFPSLSMPWPTYMGASDRSGSAGTETALSASTVGQLKLHWTLHGRGSIFSQPVVAGGLIYWGSWDGYEHATSAATGKDVWATFLGQTVNIPCEGNAVGVTSTATVAYAPVEGRRTPVVLVGGGDAVFYALNAQTGGIVWRRRLGTPPDTYLWSSPAVYQDSVYMGVSSLGDCPLVQGVVVKLSTATGAVERVFDVVPNGCTGGSIWGSVAIDQTTGTVYVATGNPGDCGASEPYTVAVVALRADDLGVIGAWQATSALQYGDSDFGSTPTLFTAQVNGATREMVGVVNKDGLFYAFDAAHVGNGPVWRTRVADVTNCPACGDGGWVPGAWDGTTLYEPGGSTTINGIFCAGGLRALQPATGAVLWSDCLAGPTFGALTLGPGFVVFAARPTLVIIGTRGATAGHILFSFQDPRASDTRFLSSATIADGVLYVGDADGNLFALGL